MLPIGRAKIERAGGQVTIVAYSIMVGVALTAAEALAGQGVEAEVINLRTLRPLDIATVVESVKKTGRLVTVEEGWPYAGIGAEVAMQVIEQAFDWLDAPPCACMGWTYRCPMRPIWKSWLCRRWLGWLMPCGRLFEGKGLCPLTPPGTSPQTPFL